MHIISKKALKDFWEKYPDSKMPLLTWFRVVKASKYASFNQLRATFKTADKVGDKIVFNIGGNKYRLVTVIHFNFGRIYVRHVLSHEAYDKGGWKHG